MQYTLWLILDKTKNEYSITKCHRRKLCNEGICSNYFIKISDEETVKIHVSGLDDKSFDSYETILLDALYNSERNGTSLKLKYNGELKTKGYVIVDTDKGEQKIKGWINIIRNS